MERKELLESDPKRHAAEIQRMLEDLIRHVRDDVDKIDDPNAKVLFDTTAEVLTGLCAAYKDYNAQTEIWSARSPVPPLNGA